MDEMFNFGFIWGLLFGMFLTMIVVLLAILKVETIFNRFISLKDREIEALQKSLEVANLANRKDKSDN